MRAYGTCGVWDCYCRIDREEDLGSRTREKRQAMREAEEQLEGELHRAEVRLIERDAQEREGR